MGVPECIAGVARQFLGTVGRVRRVGVHDPSHVWLRTVETRVHRDLTGGLQGPFQGFAVEAHEHYVFGLQNVVGEATRGYQDVPLRGAGADVARGRGHETRGAHLASDPGYLSAQLSMFHVSSPSLIASTYDGVKVAHTQGSRNPLTADLPNMWFRAGPAASALRTLREPAGAQRKRQKGRRRRYFWPRAAFLA